MPNIINIFKELSSIPRCSKTHKPFIEYVKTYASKYNYDFFVDEFHNILCKKSNSNALLCLQSHYDIVCLLDDTIPDIIENDGYLFAKDSTLGADNGIGCAYMLSLMIHNFDCEFLFTSDEEIGLIGANGLNFKLNSKYLLNLDSEQENEICIGCAGGADIFGYFKNRQIIPNNKNCELYEISINNLIGGHSGINIHENRPNAIKLLIQEIKLLNAKLLDISGGERVNSIPANAKAIIASSSTPISKNSNIIIKKIDTKAEHLTIYDDKIIDFLNTFHSGLIDFNNDTSTTITSTNLAIINTNIDQIEICIGVRSLYNEELEKIKIKIKDELQNYDFKVKISSKYQAWSPKIDKFTSQVLEIYKKHSASARLYNVHAGLETALFSQKYPNISLASIGPNIYNPHSKKEKVEIQSVENVYKIVLDIVKKFT